MRYFFFLIYVSISSFAQESIYKDKKIEIFCKKKDNNYWSLNGNLCEYQIYKNNIKVQTLKEVISIPNKFYYEDINFDGIKDFRVMKTMTKKPFNIFFIYYIFNPQTNFFHRIREYEKITRPQYIRKTKEIRSIRWEKGGERQIIETYSLKNGTPLLNTKIIIDSTTKNKYGPIIFKEVYNFTKNIMTLNWKTKRHEKATGKEHYKINNNKNKLEKKTLIIKVKNKSGKTIYAKEIWEVINNKIKLTQREKDTCKWPQNNIDYVEYNKDKD